MTELRQDFLNGMSCVAATVNVVATDGVAGRAGVTVSAMSSVSADTEKPVLLVCVNDQSAGAAPIIENGVFTVNILRDDQSFVSDTFAGRYGDKGKEKFDCAEWHVGATGAPVLNGAVASFDCKLIEDRMIGQHHVFFGEVQHVELSERGRALIYANRSYSTALSLLALDGPEGRQEGGRICIACLSSFAPLYLPSLLLRMREEMPSVQIDILEGNQAQVVQLVQAGEAEFGLLYDQDVPATLEKRTLKHQHPYVLFAKDDPRTGKAEVRLADIAGDPMILLDQPLSRDYLVNLFKDIGEEPNVVMRPSSMEMVRSLVGQGLGYAVLVTNPAGDLSYDGMPLAIRPVADDPSPISIALVKRDATEVTELGAAFREHLIAHFSGLQATKLGA